MKRSSFCLIFTAFWCMATALFAQKPALYEAMTLRPYFIQPTPDQFVVLNDEATLQQDSTLENGIRVTRKYLRDDVRKIFASYCGGWDKVNEQAIESAFGEDNPFMVIDYTSNFGLKQGKFDITRAPDAQPAAGNPVTAIADGIARFLVKRTKEELSLAFFTEFKEAVQADKKGYFRDFFRNTQQTLLFIDTEVYQFEIYLEALRESFIADLNVLPGNLSTYLRYKGTNIVKPAQQAIATDFFQLIQMNMDGAPPIEMIRYLANDTISEIQTKAINGDDLKSLAAGLHFLDLVSESLVDPSTGSWYSTARINRALSDPITCRVYLGLLWMRAEKLHCTFKNGATLGAMIARASSAAGLLDSWRQILSGFANNGIELDKSMQSRDAKSSLSENFTRCLQTFNRMLETANALNKMLNPDDGDAIDPKYFQLLQQIGSLQFNVSQKHYSAAVGNTIYILGILMGDQFNGRDEILKYGMFIAAVAEAENADEVQNAIELFALPPGSAKAKKADNTFSIAINAYTGANVSGERARNSGNSYTTLSPAAPIGFSINWGRNWGSKNKPKNGSIGVFLPVIDVGAVYAYRFKEDGVENLPAMEWRNIIAPGAYLVIDPPLGKWPLSIGLGGQLGPLLRRVDDNGELKNKDVGGYRIGGFLTFDIPVNYLRLKTR